MIEQGAATRFFFSQKERKWKNPFRDEDFELQALSLNSTVA